MSQKDVIPFVQSLIGDEDREIFLVLCMNTKNQINAIHRCHIRSINASIVSPREVFKVAILNNSTNILVAI
ncbi:JAB domain-containing protein [Bacillus sp. FSL K6-3431]|uniref:JAB domain-containing protein n=1 Tax=Bacillus sp. FSL K6-3431 TaxID=2921500 RepID=UPI0030FC11F6